MLCQESLTNLWTLKLSGASWLEKTLMRRVWGTGGVGGAVAHPDSTGREQRNPAFRLLHLHSKLFGE